MKRKNYIATPAQMEVRMSLQITVRFLQPLKGIIKMGYAEWSQTMGKRPAALANSQVMKNAVTGRYPDMFVDPAKVVLSRGSLAPIRGAIERMEQQRIKVALYSEEDLPDGRSDDEVILYAYDPVSRMVWRNDETARRSDDAVYLEAISAKPGDELHLYLMVCDRERKKFANSLYLGAWVVREN